MTTAPDQTMLRRALSRAVRAPSIYNSQPWRWRASPSEGIDLFADPNRRLISTDPQGADLLISCGAALHHLTIALAELGWGAEVTRMPEDPENIHHLAHIRPHPAATPAAIAQPAQLARAIGRRRTDRRRFSATPVAGELLDALAARAPAHDTDLHPVTGPARARLIEIITESASLQWQQVGYAAEITQWASRYTGSGDGVGPNHAVTVTAPTRRGDVPMRLFPHASLTQPTHSLDHDDASHLMILSTHRDDPLNQLHAGEAASDILLTATDLGLATTPLSQPLEVTTTRTAISTHLTGAQQFPQLILRVGWADPHAPELPPSPRRPLDNVLLSTR